MHYIPKKSLLSAIAEAKAAKRKAKKSLKSVTKAEVLQIVKARNFQTFDEEEVLSRIERYL